MADDVLHYHDGIRQTRHETDIHSWGKSVTLSGVICGSFASGAAKEPGQFVAFSMAIQPGLLGQIRTRAWWKANWIRLLPWSILLGLAVGFGIAWLASDGFRDEMHELWRVMRSGDQELIRHYLRGYGAWGPFVSVSLMLAQVILAPIPASVVQLANGVVYGKAGGAALNFVGQMLGATVAFWIARSLGEGTVEKLAGRVNPNSGGVETWLQKWGGRALFLIRAIPGMPSDFMSYVAGLTRMTFRTYVLATAAGFIPQSIVYAWLGDSAMTWFWWVVIGGFGISGVIAVATWVLQRRNRCRPARHDAHSPRAS